jgi:hypothetical protein
MNHGISSRHMTTKTLLNDGHVRVASRRIVRGAPALLRDFVTLFGASPKVCAAIWNLTLFDDDVKLQHLLWALLFLKTYQKETPLMVLAGCSCRKTFRKYLWKVLSSLSKASRSFVSEHDVYSPCLRHRVDASCLIAYCSPAD